jgi:putative phosphoribosyl transferase
MISKDRKDTGSKEIPTLDHYRNSDPLVLGIPKGGIEIAYYIAAHLVAELSVIVSNKLCHGYEENGFGAICEHGVVHIQNEKNIRSDKSVGEIIEKAKKEIQRKVKIYRGGKPLPEITGRTVILTDDGLTSGLTLVPAIRLCRQLKAAKVVVAIPLTGRIFDPLLKEADEIILIQQPELFCNIKEARKAFQTLSDSEIFSFINRQPLFFS